MPIKLEIDFICGKDVADRFVHENLVQSIRKRDTFYREFDIKHMVVYLLQKFRAQFVVQSSMYIVKLQL